MTVGYGQMQDSFRGSLEGILNNSDRLRAEQG